MTQEDRLAWFGFDALEQVNFWDGRESVVVDGKVVSPRQDQIEYLLAVERSFSFRLDGLRRCQGELKRADLARGDSR
ncbi:hypothetical protein ACQEUX_13875 [Micromonospora sp. CA-259024]|uniref:hypothetical protein n=1 Tax=Micromonospora sp. CA-259024 TaxID=3239965 RepID=UPI003D90A632